MATGSWWVVNQPVGISPKARFTNYVIVQAAARPVNAVAGPFATQAQAAAWQTSANTAGNSPGSAIGGTVNAAASSIPGLSAIGDFFGALTQSATWIRVVKVIVGGVMLVVGIAHMSGASGKIAETARKVPLPI